MWLRWTLAAGALLAAWACDEFVAGIITAAVVRWILEQVGAVAPNADVPKPKPKLPLPPSTISVVGNVGAGKSTAINAYAAAANRNVVACFTEPIDDWAPLLTAAETSTDLWFQLQVMIAAHYIRPPQVNAGIEAVVIERDLASVAVFSGNNAAMASLLKGIAATGSLHLPAAVLYISTPWDKCMARIADGRGQPGDTLPLSIGAKYFDSLETRHEKLVKWYMRHGVAVISVDNSADAAVHGLTDLEEYVESARREGKTPTILTEAMMKELLEMLWP